ncbi:Uncharacterised protein [Vibrio cholerae]|nr:Uncharacterised protein [Vibrio cholerae]
MSIQLLNRLHCHKGESPLKTALYEVMRRFHLTFRPRTTWCVSDMFHFQHVQHVSRLVGDVCRPCVPN